MAFQISYSRLAVINILHNYYLDKEGSAYYSLSQSDKDIRLTDLLMDNRYGLMDDILIKPTAETEKVLKGQKIVFRQMSTGIVLGIASSGTKPVIPIHPQLRLQFSIQLKHAALISRSNLKINPVFPACYYFTNDSTIPNKTFPSLSAKIENIVEGRIYEMGEWAVVAGNVAQAVTRSSTAANGWVNTDDVHSISEYDRILLPNNFTYTFDVSGIKKADFSLMKGAAEIKKISFKGTVDLTAVTLDFPKDAGIYTLKVTGTNNYKRSYTIYINNELYQNDTWGVLDLVLNTTDAAFQLVDNNSVIKSPVFELRFTSRSTYWKYYLQKGDTPAPDANWNDVLPLPSGMKKVIISKQPFQLMQSFRKVNYAAVSLPNPDGEQLSRQGDLICSEILLPKLKL
jgi:hypothetical protein